MEDFGPELSVMALRRAQGQFTAGDEVRFTQIGEALLRAHKENVRAELDTKRETARTEQEKEAEKTAVKTKRGKKEDE